MEKLKNFIYDKSDLLVALLIVCIAALVIWFAINNIMTPVEESAEVKTSSTVVTDTETTDAGVSSGSGVTEDDNTEDKADDADKKTDEFVTTKEIKITIASGESNNKVAENLLARGAIQSTATFLKKLEDDNLATKVQQGTFKIPKGSNLEAVIKIITRT